MFLIYRTKIKIHPSIEYNNYPIIQLLFITINYILLKNDSLYKRFSNYKYKMINIKR